MRPLRILHVTPYFSDAWAYGGIPRVAHALAHGLAERGHEVTVCITDACSEHARLQNPEPQGRYCPWLPISPGPGVVVRVFPNLSNRLAYQQGFVPLGFRPYIRQAAGAFDVAHLHACRNLPGTIAARYLRRAGVPYVVAPNGTAPRIERRRFAKRLFDATAGRRFLGGAARVIAVSEVEERQLNELGTHPGAIRLVPNPVDTSEFASPPVRGRFRQKIGVGGPLVLFLGRISPRKRLDVLVRAFARLPLPAAQLVVAGNDAGAATPARRLAEALGVAERTHFVGLLRGDERIEALADADVVVYASEHEIFGLVPLEALMAGTPVVVANDSGCADIVRATGGALVVPVGDADALSRAISQILEQPVFWRTAAMAAALHVRANYASHTVCAQLDGVYRELVGGR